MQTLCFSNPGEIDLRLITTFGANVKEGDSPIGYFGTGLKYAIAVALRLGCQVTIQSGTRVLEFGSSSQTIRGKSFEMVEWCEGNAEPVACGFTCDLGRNWEAWMAYREFWSNSRDEGGAVELVGQVPPATAGETRVLVWGEPMLEVHRLKGKFLIEGEPPLWAGEHLEIYPQAKGQGGYFYKGILIYVPPKGKNMKFRYNVVRQKVKLTEDRVVYNVYELDFIVGQETQTCTDKALVETVLKAAPEFREHDVDYNWRYGKVSEVWTTSARAEVKANPLRVNSSVKQWIANIDRGKEKPSPVLLNPIEEKQMLRALAFCQNMGWEITAEVVVTDSLGESVLGMAEGGVIYISKRCFEEGTKVLAGTLLEEHWHLTEHVEDETRRMQNFLINTICSLGERLQGEPL